MCLQTVDFSLLMKRLNKKAKKYKQMYWLKNKIQESLNTNLI